MSLRQVPLSGISLEFPERWEIKTDADPDHPLVVIEEEGRLFLVDGYKRFFALKARGVETAWVLVKAWTPAEAKVHRLRLNNPTRRTALREELKVLDDLHRAHGLSAHAIARALGKKKAWVERRLAILETLSTEAACLIP